MNQSLGTYYSIFAWLKTNKENAQKYNDGNILTNLICSQGIGMFSRSLRMAWGMYLRAPRYTRLSCLITTNC